MIGPSARAPTTSQYDALFWAPHPEEEAHVNDYRSGAGNAASACSGKQPPSSPLSKLLVASGIAASLFYVAANLLGALHWDGYSSVDQTISELFAVDAPSRPIFLAFSVPYGVLSLAFGAAVVWAARVTVHFGSRVGFSSRPES